MRGRPGGPARPVAGAPRPEVSSPERAARGRRTQQAWTGPVFWVPTLPITVSSPSWALDPRAM